MVSASTMSASLRFGPLIRNVSPCETASMMSFIPFLASVTPMTVGTLSIRLSLSVFFPYRNLYRNLYKKLYKKLYRKARLVGHLFRSWPLKSWFNPHIVGRLYQHTDVVAE